MAFTVSNFENNDDVRKLAELGQFSVVEWQRDLSVSPWSAQTAWFASEMNVRRRQLLIKLDGRTGVTLQAGAMQWTVGDVQANTGVKGAGDLMGKMFRGAVSQDTMIKPEYTGTGMLVCEPTWQFIQLINLAQWGNSIVLNDGLFLACDSTISDSLQRRANMTSALAGNEGLFNLRLDGAGVVALETPCPLEEIVVIDLQNDELKIDGNYALAWSSSLDFTVERSGKSLIGSAASGEGLVNVYRGTGRVLMAPMQPATNYNVNAAESTD
ncbi:MAG: AIM24 family protein [Coriobacteriaceae bacterium]|nr:AIM24 family protein [Coriobacteriaceae bacterium]